MSVTRTLGKDYERRMIKRVSYEGPLGLETVEISEPGHPTPKMIGGPTDESTPGCSDSPRRDK